MKRSSLMSAVQTNIGEYGERRRLHAARPAAYMVRSLSATGRPVQRDAKYCETVVSKYTDSAKGSRFRLKNRKMLFR